MEFASVIKLRALRWEVYPGLLSGPWISMTKGCRRLRIKGDVVMEAETGVVHVQDEGKDHEPRNAGRGWMLKKAPWGSILP